MAAEEAKDKGEEEREGESWKEEEEAAAAKLDGCTSNYEKIGNQLKVL